MKKFKFYLWFIKDVKKQLRDLIDDIPEGQDVLHVVYESLALYNNKTHFEITNELNLTSWTRLEYAIEKSMVFEVQ